MKYAGKFWDASYGNVHNNRSEWENASLAGTKAERSDNPFAAQPVYFVAVKKNVENGADEKDVFFRIKGGNDDGLEVGN